MCPSSSKTFYIFIFFFRTTGPISTKLCTNHLWVKGTQVFQIKGPALFQWEIITKLRKYIGKFKKSSFSRTPGPILTNLGTNHLWVKGIQVCSNEGPVPFPRGDNYKICKNTITNLKNLFFGTAGPIFTNLGTNYPWMKEIQICSNEVLPPFPRGNS